MLDTIANFSDLMFKAVATMVLPHREPFCNRNIAYYQPTMVLIED